MCVTTLHSRKPVRPSIEPAVPGVSDGRMPVIRKANRIIGNQLVLRNASVGDAVFILQLRTDPRKARFISSTSPDPAQQAAWLTNYDSAMDQAYFVIEDKSGEKVGTIRIYDSVKDSFCWGSWILRAGVPATYAVESVLVLYHYAMENLGFSRSYFAVRKANRSVWHFMEKFGGVRTGMTDMDFLYEASRDSVQPSFRRYSRLLPKPIQVIDDSVS